MKYVNNVEIGKKIILDNYPEFKNSQFVGDNSGWTNFAIKVDNKYLFRFPKNDEAYVAINKEYKILEILNKKLPSNIKVPNYIFSNLDCDFPYVGYELIEGSFLTKKVFNELSENEKKSVLNNMAEFLNILHSVNYNELGLIPIDSKKWYQNLYTRIQNICYKYFDDNLKPKTDKLFEDFFNDETMHNFIPTLVHGDLSQDHILITNNGVGIIDFGDLMVFDPAYDLIWAYICDVNFFYELLAKYNGNKDNYFEHRIRDFHMIRPPYDGIIYADEINDKEMLEKMLKRLENNFKNRSSKND